MSINEFTDGELITAPRLNEMADQLNTRYYTVDETVGRVVKVWDYLNNREQMIYGDTGERDITSLLSPAPVSGKLILSRENNRTQMEFRGLVLQPVASSYLDFNGLIPSGFRNKTGYAYFSRVARYASDGVSGFRIDSYGGLGFYSVTANEAMNGVFTWRTSEPWPTTLPGVAA